MCARKFSGASLEAQSDEIETIGFAGFFGMAIEYLKFGQPTGGAQCPVLLTPKIKVREALRRNDGGAEGALLRQMNFRQTVNGAWNSFKTSAISCFSFVETAGLWFGVKLAQDSLALAAPELAFRGARRKVRARKSNAKSAARKSTATIWKPASRPPTKSRWPPRAEKHGLGFRFCESGFDLRPRQRDGEQSLWLGAGLRRVRRSRGRRERARRGGRF